MRIAVTGSVATDHLMTFPGRFTEQLLPDQLDRVSVSFLVDDLEVRRGGVAANICFGMAQLGLHPVLVGAVGADFDEYRSWLERHGVDTSGVHVSELRHTARFICTTDRDQNQIASFYPGAMSEARDIELGPLVAQWGGVDLVVVAPNDPAAMVRHTEECRERELVFAADPSQQLSSLDGAQVRELLVGARYLFTNDYEAGLIHAKTGWSADEVVGQVGAWVTTHGSKGVVVRRAGEPDVAVAAVPAQREVDPTGVGDAFRAGFLAGRACGLGHERSAQVGALLATYCLETVGTQEYVFDLTRFGERLAGAYGAAAADEVVAKLARVP